MKIKVIAFLAIAGIAFACQDNDPMTQSKIDLNPELKSRITPGAINTSISGQRVADLMTSINDAIAPQGIMLEKIEFLGAEQAGNTVFFSDRGNKQLTSDYVPNDPRDGNGTDVPYVIDGTELGTSSGMSDFETYQATVNAMDTWGNVKCSGGLNIPSLGVTPFDFGYVQYLLGFGGFPGYFLGTIAHAGVLPAAFFDAFEPGGGSFILGVTFTFVYFDDLDEDGRDDVAIKELYMNDAFNWQDEPNDGLGNGIYDYETVVLHEVGHALSQAHFGKVSRTNSNGKLHFSPGALMNAGYSVARRSVEKTDKAGHCSNWGNWPNN